MRNFLYFLWRHINTLLFVLLESLCAVLIVTSNDYQRASFLSSANFVSGAFYEMTSSVTHYFGLSSANAALLKQNVALMEEVERLRGELRSQADTLHEDTLLVGQGMKLRYRPAHIVNSTTTHSRNMLTADAGTNDGITEDMAVVNAQGVVGLVAAVSSHYSLILPIINTSSHLSVKLKGTNHRGQLSWDGFSPLKADMTDVPEHAKVSIGDTVVTSGSSSYFPEGLMVGIVGAVEQDKNGGFFKISIDLATDFNSVYEVEILEDIRRDEQTTLEKSISNE